jgi:Transposase
MAFLSEHRENDQPVLSQESSSQMSLRSSGGRCQKSHATSPPAQSIARWPHLGARYPAPIEPPATRRCERFISRPSPHERSLAVGTCPARRCRSFLSQSPFQSEALPRIEEVFLLPTSLTFSIEGSAGCWNGSQLSTEVKALGYTGSEALFRLFISSVRKQHQATGTSEKLELSAHGQKVSGPIDAASKPSIKRRLSPTRASWLYVSQAVKLDEKQRLQVAQIRAAHDDLDLAYELTQAFVSMLAEHQDTALDDWLAQAEHGGIKELKSFATSHPARLRRRARHVHFRMEQRSG